MDKYISCRLCKCTIRNDGTDLCNRCFELEHRIQADPRMARNILDDFEAKDINDRTLTDESPLWEIVELLYRGQRNLTSNNHCYSHTMDKHEQSISNTDVEMVIERLKEER